MAVKDNMKKSVAGFLFKHKWGPVITTTAKNTIQSTLNKTSTKKIIILKFLAFDNPLLGMPQAQGMTCKKFM